MGQGAMRAQTHLDQPAWIGILTTRSGCIAETNAVTKPSHKQCKLRIFLSASRAPDNGTPWPRVSLLSLHPTARACTKAGGRRTIDGPDPAMIILTISERVCMMESCQFVASACDGGIWIANTINVCIDGGSFRGVACLDDVNRHISTKTNEFLGARCTEAGNCRTRLAQIYFWCFWRLTWCFDFLLNGFRFCIEEIFIFGGIFRSDSFLWGLWALPKNSK